MELSPHVPISDCRLVKYDDYTDTLDESFDLEEVRVKEGRVSSVGWQK